MAAGKPTAAGMVVFGPSGRVLLRKVTGGFGGATWTFPKGGLDGGQDHAAGAVKETHEETGIQAEPVGGHIGDFEGTTSTVRYYMGKIDYAHAHYYDLKAGKPIPKGEPGWESEGVYWATVEEAKALIATNPTAKVAERELAALNAAVAAHKATVAKDPKAFHTWATELAKDAMGAIRKPPELKGWAPPPVVQREPDALLALQYASDAKAWQAKLSKLTAAQAKYGKRRVSDADIANAKDALAHAMKRASQHGAAAAAGAKAKPAAAPAPDPPKAKQPQMQLRALGAPSVPANDSPQYKAAVANLADAQEAYKAAHAPGAIVDADLREVLAMQLEEIEYAKAELKKHAHPAYVKLLGEYNATERALGAASEALFKAPQHAKPQFQAQLAALTRKKYALEDSIGGWRAPYAPPTPEPAKAKHAHSALPPAPVVPRNATKAYQMAMMEVQLTHADYAAKMRAGDVSADATRMYLSDVEAAYAELAKHAHPAYVKLQAAKEAAEAQLEDAKMAAASAKPHQQAGAAAKVKAAQQLYYDMADKAYAWEPGAPATSGVASTTTALRTAQAPSAVPANNTAKYKLDKLEVAGLEADYADALRGGDPKAIAAFSKDLADAKADLAKHAHPAFVALVEAKEAASAQYSAAVAAASQATRATDIAKANAKASAALALAHDLHDKVSKWEPTKAVAADGWGTFGAAAATAADDEAATAAITAAKRAAWAEAAAQVPAPAATPAKSRTQLEADALRVLMADAAVKKHALHAALKTAAQVQTSGRPLAALEAHIGALQQAHSEAHAAAHSAIGHSKLFTLPRDISAFKKGVGDTDSAKIDKLMDAAMDADADTYFGGHGTDKAAALAKAWRAHAAYMDAEVAAEAKKGIGKLPEAHAKALADHAEASVYKTVWPTMVDVHEAAAKKLAKFDHPEYVALAKQLEAAQKASVNAEKMADVKVADAVVAATKAAMRAWVPGAPPQADQDAAIIAKAKATASYASWKDAHDGAYSPEMKASTAKWLAKYEHPEFAKLALDTEAAKAAFAALKFDDGAARKAQVKAALQAAHKAETSWRAPTPSAPLVAPPSVPTAAPGDDDAAIIAKAKLLNAYKIAQSIVAAPGDNTNANVVNAYKVLAKFDHPEYAKLALDKIALYKAFEAVEAVHPADSAEAKAAYAAFQRGKAALEAWQLPPPGKPPGAPPAASAAAPAPQQPPMLTQRVRDMLQALTGMAGLTDKWVPRETPDGRITPAIREASRGMFDKLTNDRDKRKAMAALYTEAAQELANKLAAKLAAGKGDTYTAHLHRQALIQVKQGVMDLGGKMRKRLTADTREVIEGSLAMLTAEVSAMEDHYSGAMHVLPLAQAARFGGVVDAVDTSVMRRQSVSMARYGARLVGQMERELMLSMATGETPHEAVQRVQKVAMLNYWQAERIARTETAWAYNATRAEGVAELAAATGDTFKRWVENIDDETGRPYDDRVAGDSLALHGQIVPAGGMFTMPNDTRAPAKLWGKQYAYPPNRPNDRACVEAWRPHWDDVDGYVLVDGVRTPAREVFKGAGARPAGPADPVPAAPAAEPAPDMPKVDWPADPRALRVVSKLGGSTGAELVETPDGRRFVRKQAGGRIAPEHLREEATADAAYTALGIRTPPSKLYEHPTLGPTKLTPFIEGRQLSEFVRVGSDGVMRLRGTLSDKDVAIGERALEDARKGFAADALLGCWDSVGMNADNMLVDPQGNAWRIDNGGALRYRAQGAPKGDGWNGQPSELWSMRGPMHDKPANTSAHSLFGPLSWGDVSKQLVALDGRLDAVQKILDARDPALGRTFAKRVDAARDAVVATRPMIEDHFQDGYVNLIAKHTAMMRHVTAKLPKQLTPTHSDVDKYIIDATGARVKVPNTHGTTLVDENGVEWDHVRDRDGKDSLQRAWEAYMKANGADPSMFAKYTSEQGGSSQSMGAMNVKRLLWAHGLGFARGDNEAYWARAHGGELTPPTPEHVRAAEAAFGGKDAALESLTGMHAWTMATLRHIQMPNNDHATGTLHIFRTESEQVLNAAGIRRGAKGKMPRGVAESGSLLQPIRVRDDELTTQQVPHHRVLVTYIPDASGRRGRTCMYRQSENEFVFVAVNQEFTREGKLKDY